jgi:glycosyltransferase involved in cell wall biosynthesis
MLITPKKYNIRIAVLIPCFNEGLSIRKTVEGFRSMLPESVIYVYDNNSVDNTSEEAQIAGAVVCKEVWPGKGNVVRRMFTEIEADVYLIADGDGTYDCRMSQIMIEKLIIENLDMVVGIRKNLYENAHRKGHGFGNRVFNGLYRFLFGRLFSDIFSGYRVFSRRFVKSFPAISSGFEIETEMSVHCSQLRLPIAEVETDYSPRQQGSESKLHTVRDGLRIMFTIIILFKEVRPALFFGILASTLTAISFFLSFPLFLTYLDIGLVPRLPTAILSTGLVLLSGIFMASGFILDSVARGRLEQKRMWYMINSSK